MKAAFARCLVPIMLCCGLVSPTSADTAIWPLSKLTPAKDVELRCISASETVYLPIPQRWDIRKAILRFPYTNSAALLKGNSLLTVNLNRSPLAQVKLDPLAPEGIVEIPLPPVRLEPGYNTIEFKIAQHYSLGCEEPCAPELWTNLKLGEATLEFDYELLPVPKELSAISGFLFDPKIVPQGHVNFVYDNPAPGPLSLAAVAASGIALRFDYRHVQFTSSSDILPAVDNVLIGEKTYVEGFLNQHGINLDVQGPVIQILHLPDRTGPKTPASASPQAEGSPVDQRHALLVLAGRDDKEAKIAAESFAVLSGPFPDSDRMSISSFSLPEIRLYAGKRMLIAGERYPFKKLGYTSHNFQGFNSGTTEINFRLPPDFLIKPNQQVTLSLDFSYGAGLRQDSVLNVLLNGEFVHAALLEGGHGGLITGYTLALPTFLFRSGANTLSFKPAMAPLLSEHCSFVQTENLQLTLYDSSTLFFPEMPHRIEMPKLDLFFINGFPFTRWPDGFESTIYLTKSSRTVADAMLNLVALMSQKNGYPLFGIEIATEAPSQSEHELLVLGPLGSIPEKIIQAAPLVLGPSNKVPYSVFESWGDRSALALSEQTSEVGPNKGILMQFQSPYMEGRTAMIVTATTDEGVLRLVDTLYEPKLQTQAKGDLLIADFSPGGPDNKRPGGDEPRVTAMQAGQTYVTGKGGKISKADFYLSSYPWIYWTAVALAVLLLSVALYFLVKRQQRRRLGGL
jgi:hypothetical protein